MVNPSLVNRSPYDVAFFLRPSKGTLDISSSPPSAEIYLDGRYVGVTPKVIRDIDRTKDQVFVLIRKDGYRERKVTLNWGKKVRHVYETNLEAIKNADRR